MTQFTSNPEQAPDAIICPLFQNDERPEWLDRLPLGDADLAKGKITPLFSQGDGPHRLIVGLGKQLASTGESWRETLRFAAGCAGRVSEGYEWKRVTVEWTDEEIASPEAAGAWVEGWLLGTYQFDAVKSKKRTFQTEEIGFPGIAEDDLRDAAGKAQIRAAATCFARDLGNEPPNRLRPSDLCERVAARFKDNPAVETKVYTGEDIAKHSFSGLAAVGRGSDHPPALLQLTYCTDDSLPLITLVGKGITFDTGGISLKKGRDLSDMRLDMCGAAAVAGALDILVNTKAPANVVVLIAAAENMPDGRSLLPGEVITYADGTTVQVGNTDAEGRLVLADALIHARQFEPAEIVDIATLTGACVVSLGDRIAGVWTNSEDDPGFVRASKHSGDKVWLMPLEEEYDGLLASTYADTSNIGKGAYAGAITAALFLRKFIQADVIWSHVDMAGPMEASSTKGYIPAGATGFGARLLAEYVLNRHEQARINA